MIADWMVRSFLMNCACVPLLTHRLDFSGGSTKSLMNSSFWVETVNAMYWTPLQKVHVNPPLWPWHLVFFFSPYSTICWCWWWSFTTTVGAGHACRKGYQGIDEDDPFLPRADNNSPSYYRYGSLPSRPTSIHEDSS